MDDVRAKVAAWIEAQGFPPASEARGEIVVAASKLIAVLEKCRHDPIGQAFNLYHGIRELVVEAAGAAS